MKLKKEDLELVKSAVTLMRRGRYDLTGTEALVFTRSIERLAQLHEEGTKEAEADEAASKAEAEAKAAEVAKAIETAKTVLDGLSGEKVEEK
jgi:hypothetical protein